MIRKWLQYLLWQPYALMCRRFPLWPFRVTITEPIEHVVCIKIDNLITRLLSRFGGGYDFSVSYLVDETLLIDTGFPWARRKLKQTLIELGVVDTITKVVNTHYHEDHTGNNDLLVELCHAQIFAHRDSISVIRFPPELPWYRNFLFGPSQITDVTPLGQSVETDHSLFEVVETPGHCPGHICLFEPNKKLLFSGDLYIAADLDSQLQDANGPKWITSLETTLKLKPEWLFDAHGTIFEGAQAVEQQLQRKLNFLITIRNRVNELSTHAQPIQELTRKVFDRHNLVDFLSFGDGWLSLITGSDFSRSNIVKSFLREKSPIKPASLN